MSEQSEVALPGRMLEKAVPEETLRTQLRTEAIKRAPLDYVHRASENSWDSSDPEAAAKILLASFTDDTFGSSITDKLLEQPHPEVPIRFDRIAEIYKEALHSSAELPVDAKRKLLASVVSLPFDEMPLHSSLSILGTLSDTYKDEVPDIAFRFNPDVVLAEFDSTDSEDQILGNLLRTRRYYEEPQEIAAITEKIADWAARPDGGKQVVASFNGENLQAADVYLFDVFDSLSEHPEEQHALTQRLVRDNVPLSAVLSYIKEGFIGGKSDAENVYHDIAALRPEQIAFDGIQLQLTRGEYYAREGRLADAREAAQTMDYSDYSYIMMNIAKNQYESGDQEGALATLDDVFSKDPTTDFEHTEDKEEHVLYMGGNPRGVILESLAKTYLSIGAIPQAVNAYTESRTTELKLGEISIKQDQASNYLNYLVTNNSIALRTRAGLAAECLRHANKEWGMNDQKQAELSQLYAIAQPLIEDLKEKLDATENNFSRKLIRAQATALLSQSGRVDEALEMIDPEEHSYAKGSIVEEAIIATAYTGDSQKAWDTYLEHPDRPEETVSKERSQKAILEVALIKGDYNQVREVVDDMRDYTVTANLANVYEQHKDVLFAAPDWLVEQFLVSPYDEQNDSSKFRLKRLARLL